MENSKLLSEYTITDNAERKLSNLGSIIHYNFQIRNESRSYYQAWCRSNLSIARSNLNRAQLRFGSSLETVHAITVFQEDLDIGMDITTLIGMNYVRELKLISVQITWTSFVPFWSTYVHMAINNTTIVYVVCSNLRSVIYVILATRPIWQMIQGRNKVL